MSQNNEQQIAVVDVRTPMEYSSGHVVGSVNIPLNELPQRMGELKGIDKPIVLCCASGMRSGQATQFLAQSGFANVTNGGSWTDVQYQLMNKVN